MPLSVPQLQFYLGFTRHSKGVNKMKKYIGIKEFEAELILVDPKENIKVEDDEKIDAFCQRLKGC